MPQPETTLERGRFAEDLAFDYLLKSGLKLLVRNYRCPRGEIDIIMQHDETIAFIEVRYRKNDHYISTIETIDKRKCKCIIETSQHFLQANRKVAKYPCRFDVITLTGNLTTPDIKWIKNAFQA
jgi:putative endonuclease